VQVAEVGGHVHDLVVAKHHVHPATSPGRLALQAVHEPQETGHVRAAVREVTGEDQVLAAARPLQRLANQAGRAQGGRERIEMPVRVTHDVE
jgi:hypothetical protein